MTNAPTTGAPARLLNPIGFTWAVGIEDTAIGTPIRDGGRRLDEYELTGHYSRWLADLDRVADLGCTAMRYGLPWYRVNPEPGRWEWSWLDKVVAAAADRGVDIIADLVHYGTPTWLPDAFTDPRYPRAVADFAGAVAERYTDSIAAITPLNEPLVTASFCGERAVWPPYGRGDHGWVDVVLGVARGIQATVSTVRKANDRTQIVHVEAANVWNTADPTLADVVEHRRLRNFAPTDLVLGLVDHDHPLRPWLLAYGADEAVLEELVAGGVAPDVIGLNYYPELSCRELVRVGADVVAVAVPGGGRGLAQVLDDFDVRYRLPLFVAETGVEGDAEAKTAWLTVATDVLSDLRREGVPVLGLTWWPLFDFVDWGWASAGRVVEEFYLRGSDGRVHPVQPPGRGDDVTDYLRRMGLYRLEGAQMERVGTNAVEHFRRLAATSLPALTDRVDAAQEAS